MKKKNPADAPRSITVRAAKKREAALAHKFWKRFYALEARVYKLESRSR